MLVLIVFLLKKFEKYFEYSLNKTIFLLGAGLFTLTLLTTSYVQYDMSIAFLILFIGITMR